MIEPIKIPHWSDLPAPLKSAINRAELRNGLCPPRNLIFTSYYQFPLQETKVVIIGSEPHHRLGLSNGLAFGLTRGTERLDSSMRNIQRELARDLGIKLEDTTLEKWTKQGVLLLNHSMTCEANRPKSHVNLGWKSILIQTIKDLDNQVQNKVYLLWGEDAYSLLPEIDSLTNLVLFASHPSGFHAHETSESIPAFIGSGHFGDANDYLERRGRSPIKW